VARRIRLRSYQSPGDLVAASASLRDLHLAHPGQFHTDLRTSADDLFRHNPWVTKLIEADGHIETIDLHYPLVNQSNQRPLHFLHGFALHLEERLGVRIPLTQFRGDIHLAESEKELPAPLAALGVEGPFWILIAGGKRDFTAKWADPAMWEAVVRHFDGRILFAQCGEAAHWQPRIPGAIDLVGKTTIREFVRLIYHADGVCCPVTFAMHLAAAVPTKPGKPTLRPCVVVAGGREPAHWEQYPGHAFLDTVGRLPCCAAGGCWKSRCQLVGDGDPKDSHDVCERPVQITPDLRIAECVHSITAADVIRAVEGYYQAGVLQYLASGGRQPPVELSGGRQPPVELASGGRQPPVEAVNGQEEVGSADLTPNAQRPTPIADQEPMTVPVLLDFRHGLGDAVQLTSVLRHLRHYHPEWAIDVVAAIGKHSAYRGLCRRVFIRDRSPVDRSAYAHVFELGWHECPKSYASHPSTKAEQCLLDVFGLAPVPELCRYQIDVSAAVRAAAERSLESLCPMGPADDGRWPVVLIHYQGNTSTDKKDLPHDLIRAVCDEVIAAGSVPVILDWDRRSPLPDGVRIHNPGADDPIWGATGTGDAEMLTALIAASTLMVAVDSGPLHVAGATATPTLAVWTRHHPLHYLAPADNVFHMLPDGHEAHLRGDRAAGAAYFAEHYHHVVYHDLAAELLHQVRQRLPSQPDGLIYTRGFWVRRDNTAQDLVVVDDVARRDCYRIAEMPLPGPTFVDVGAHIGTAAATFHRRYPTARIIAVECCPENMRALRRNVGRFATVVQAALSYDAEVALLNSVYSDCASTGGSTVISRRKLAERLAQSDSAATSVGNALPGVPSDVADQRLTPNAQRLFPPTAQRLTPHSDFPIPTSDFATAPRLGEYWADTRPLRTITLEALMAEHGLDWIDVLKLDCEGCEMSLFENCQALDRVGLIVGEFHGRERFLDVVARRFADWKLEILRAGDPGTFWLSNPRTADPARWAPPTTPTSAPVPYPLSPVTSLQVRGRSVELTSDHALRFTAGPDGSLIPTLYFRGRELSQPWTLELAATSVGNAVPGVPRAADAGPIHQRANDAPARSAIQNPRSAIRNPQSLCRHLGAQTHLRECKTC